eukprot:gnl/TRDRNA2_/TRDRNA2_130813_c1_seq1.p1 gnl/TRDRNA2_/TRDRNA2_130813_c1~~gnl/TRDRNA2_/TRDRNA2_130813_c1_seq1.p1  ORF type:complete len:641 (+),score=67.07 gnl/TRDRNA2_/TRDRNA2_130813_c1_seq1:251-1924(+)
MSDLTVSYTLTGNHIVWNFDGGNMPIELYLMPAKSLELGTQSYFSLIGKPRVLPRYAFGFTASRWGWKNKSYIEGVLEQFRAERFPADAFIVDFEFFTGVNDYAFPPQGVEGYEDFGFNEVTFPEPKAQLSKYRSDLHFRMGAIRKPRLGNSHSLSLARNHGWTRSDGAYANARYLDLSQQAVRDWYSQQISQYHDDGIEFWWNDEGEASYYTYYYWNLAEQDALRKHSATKRFYTLNRGFSPGMARLGAAVWTGDLFSSWEELRGTPGMMLNWGLAGAPYVACDIGGFFHAPSAPYDPDLLIRWYQVGAFMPLMRVHSHSDSKPNFPFANLWGEKASAIMRQALDLRYRLLPYHYSLAHAMYDTGHLWMRPLAMDFPDDAKVSELTTQWLDGALLVAPVLHKESFKHVYLPAGAWYAFNSTDVAVGPLEVEGMAPLSEIPVFVRRGAVVPLAPEGLQHTDALPGGPLEVQVYSGESGSFELVEDDGETMAYESPGSAVRRTLLNWDDAARKLSWSVSGTPGAQAFTRLSVVLFSPTGVRRSGVRQLNTHGSISFAV